MWGLLAQLGLALQRSFGTIELIEENPSDMPTETSAPEEHEAAEVAFSRLVAASEEPVAIESAPPLRDMAA